MKKAMAGVLVVAAAIVGCAGEAPDDDATGEDMLTAGSAAQRACGAKFQPAFKEYQAAVAGAKARLAQGAGACTLPHLDDTQVQIANHATAAIMACPPLKDLIRTAPFAEPIRKALAESLTLRALTGELLVLRDTEFANWTGVDKLLPGTTFSTEVNGAVGVHEAITFRANGKATFTKVEAIDREPFSRTTVTPATYRVDKLGAEKDMRRITIVRGGKSEKLDLVVFGPNEPNFTTAPAFMLRAQGLEGLHFENTAMSSLHSECGD